MTKFAFRGWIGLLLAASTGACALPTGEEHRPWRQASLQLSGAHFGADLKGEIVNQSMLGTAVLTTEVQGQDDRKTVPAFAGSIWLGPVEVAASYFTLDQDGQGTFTGKFQNFTLNGMLRSEFELENLRGTLGLNLFEADRGRVAVVAGIDYYGVDLLVQDLNTQLTNEDSENLPVPVLGLRGDLRIAEAVRIHAEALGMDARLNGKDVNLLDLEAMLVIAPFEQIDLLFGYRMVALEFTKMSDPTTTISTDIDLNGPFAGVAVRF